MPTEIFKVVCYYKNADKLQSVSTVHRGNYDSCLRFYMENKVKYREENKFLELMIG